LGPKSIKLFESSSSSIQRMKRNRYASLVVLGSIYTPLANGDDRWAEGMACIDEKIVFVGSAEGE
jgi:hypothetical protein